MIGLVLMLVVVGGLALVVGLQLYAAALLHFSADDDPALELAEDRVGRGRIWRAQHRLVGEDW